MVSLITALLGFVTWTLDRLGIFASKPRLTLALSESDSLEWVVRVPRHATTTLVNHSRVIVKNEGKVAAKKVQVMFIFPDNLVREVAERTGSFGFPEDEDTWRKYPQGSSLVLEFTGDKTIPPKDEAQLGNLRLPLTGGRVVSNRFECRFKVSAENAEPKEGTLDLLVDRSDDD